MKRMTFPLLVLALAVFAGVPAEAGKHAAISPSVACLGGTVTWQPTSITGSSPLMPVQITYTGGDSDGDTIFMTVGNYSLPEGGVTTSIPCTFNVGNLPSTVTGTDTSSFSDTVLLQPTKCGTYFIPVTCSESDGATETKTVQVQTH